MRAPEPDETGVSPSNPTEGADESLTVSPTNLEFVEGLYYRFIRDPASVDEPWRRVFAGLPATPSPPERFPRSVFAGRDGRARDSSDEGVREERIHRLIQAYRELGHRAADLDPLGRAKRSAPLHLEAFGLSEDDLDAVCSTEDVAGPDTATLRELVDRLADTYTRSIGAEVGHIQDPELRRWLLQRMESTRNRMPLGFDDKRRLLERVTQAEVLEQFLHAKFLGAKRFSLEGAESLIPLLDWLLARAAEHGVTEVVVGMAHRGRLNVLANVLGKPAAEIFAEFIDHEVPLAEEREGDVKYHLGYSNDLVYGQPHDQVRQHVSLAFNPSHLEWVDTVVQGRVRAKQDRLRDSARVRGLPLLIHGDAAFAGQGIVAEALNLSRLDAYSVGGTIHVVVNNQIGFTTTPREATSGTYCTDLARGLDVPIFHVNGEDPEAVAQVASLAIDLRQGFHRDVIIDLWCYRKYGHNEGDEPSFTQPLMVRAINDKRPIREIYLARLAEGPEPLADDEGREMAERHRRVLDEELERARGFQSPPRPSMLGGAWAPYRGGVDAHTPDVPTAVDPARLEEVSRALTTVPPGFSPHPKIRKLIESRAAMAAGERPLDWGMGEALALGTLLAEGTRVRLSGQDTARGTFSHRHAVLFDQETGEPYTPLRHIGAKQGVFDVCNSPLSEAGVLGFEYGYSLDLPEGLVIWEAQFGDFMNAAQVIIDQFLVSSEAKWHRISGLTLFLPHGMEGQGPEHSSGRLERFLNMSVQDNIQVCNLTTPAQLFHVLRRQVRRPLRKPLVIMSPKSLLRHPAAVSRLDELTSGAFRPIIPDRGPTEGGVDPAAVRRVLLCTGKIFYELEAARRERNAQDVAIIRVEQLYPLRKDVLLETLSLYRGGTPVVWVQEEPRNMAAWTYMNRVLPGLLRGDFPWSCISRQVSASPATGSAARHKLEQAWLVDHAVGRKGRS